MEEPYGKKSYFSICCIEGLESIAGRSVECKDQKYRSQCFIPEGKEEISAATFKMSQIGIIPIWFYFLAEQGLTSLLDYILF